MTASPSTPEPVAELVARPMFVGDSVPIPDKLEWDTLWRLLATSSAGKDDQRFAAGWIATLTAERDAAVASGQQFVVLFEAWKARAERAEAERDAATARIAELEADVAFVENSRRLWKSQFGQERDRADAATALASKARGAALEEEEDERDRLYAEAKALVSCVVTDGRDDRWRNITTWWLEDQGAMLPAERARIRALAASGEAE